MVAALDNPPEYNRSVRDFDIVTLDRVRRMDIGGRLLTVWKEYARTARHGTRRRLDLSGTAPADHFYQIETTVDGKRFVTARGWEDISSSCKCARRWTSGG